MVAKNVVTDRPTDGRNDKSNTVTLAAHACQGLISQYNHYDRIHFYLSSTTQRGTEQQGNATYGEPSLIHFPELSKVMA